MRRWLIALFTCHFLLGVVGFTISDRVLDLPGAAAALAEAPGAAEGAAHQGASQLAHALADELPDLPDSLQRRDADPISHVMTPLGAHTPVAQLPRPASDALFRPPRLA